MLAVAYCDKRCRVAQALRFTPRAESHNRRGAVVRGAHVLPTVGMSEHASNRGMCPACRREGHVGHACQHGSCAHDGLRFIPESAAAHLGRVRDPLVGHVVAHHLVVERVYRPNTDQLYRAIQLPAMLEVELALVPSARPKDVHDTLYRQALALGRLGAHPNTTRLVFFGADANGTFLVSESQSGASTLADVVTPDGNEPIPSTAARIILGPLAAALGALARAHLVHGEIRPEHVLMREEPGYPAFVQLGGFVRIPPPEPRDTYPTHEGVWRAPEQLSDDVVNATTDAYAVAAIAYALLFGHLPFSSDDRDALFEQKLDPHRDATSELSGNVPSEVIAFFQAALAFDPAERFTDAGFREALGAALDALAVSEGVPGIAVSRGSDDGAREPRRERPPRFHRAPVHAPDVGTSERDETSAGEAHRPHAGTTQEMSVDEIESLASHRPPRMHRRPEPGGR